VREHVFRERDGALELVGDFEALYRAEADPWGQSGKDLRTASYYRFSRRRLSDAILRHALDWPRGIEIGCGSGYVLKHLSGMAGRWDGMDVSETAAAEARKRNPRATVYVGSIAAAMPLPPNVLGSYDVAILSQVLWYVLEAIDSAVTNTARLVRPGGLVIVSQAFLKEQRYGRDIADGFRGTLAPLLARFPDLEPVEARYDDSDAHAFRDGLIVLRKAGHG
jgi:SAM-dependent methyltransferase